MKTSQAKFSCKPPGDAQPIDAAFAASILPRREHGTHKWRVGGLIIVAGAPSYVGAAALCASAAGRAGAGLVHLAIPRGLVGAIAAFVPETAYILLPDSDGPSGGWRAATLIGEKLEKSNAVVIGPGLGDDDATHGLLRALFDNEAHSRQLDNRIGFENARQSASPIHDDLRQVVGQSGKPLVIDADALNWLSKQENWWELLLPGTAVLTPHLGEMARLLAIDPEEVSARPMELAIESARKWRQTVLLKFEYSIATDGERTFMAVDAPTSLASAGTGDVLAGTVGAFLAQGLEPLEAAALAMYVGCAAARRVEIQTGSLGLIASDLPPAIAAELGVLEREYGSNGS